LLLENELCVCELEEILFLKQVNISKNLSSLKEAGIVDVRRYKQRAFYFINDLFLESKHLVQHIKDLRLQEPVLQKDYQEFIKHEEVKDQNVYVCNIFRDEVTK
jgi:ArsR family transcriptional regulator